MDNFFIILSRERVVDNGMGHLMGMADICHYLIAIMQEHCKRIPNRDFLKRYFNKQSGHGDNAVENYVFTLSMQ